LWAGTSTARARRQARRTLPATGRSTTGTGTLAASTGAACTTSPTAGTLPLTLSPLRRRQVLSPSLFHHFADGRCCPSPRTVTPSRHPNRHPNLNRDRNSNRTVTATIHTTCDDKPPTDALTANPSTQQLQTCCFCCRRQPVPRPVGGWRAARQGHATTARWDQVLGRLGERQAGRRRWRRRRWRGWGGGGGGGAVSGELHARGRRARRPRCVRVKWKCASSKHTKSGGGKSGGRRCGNPVSCLAVAWSISSIVIRFFVLLTKLEIYERCCASYALYAPIQIPVAGARPLRRSLRAAWVPAALAVGGRGGGGPTASSLLGSMRRRSPRHCSALSACGVAASRRRSVWRSAPLSAGVGPVILLPQQKPQLLDPV
jgi:hypothetical protein